MNPMEQPGAADLLDIARATLLEVILPQLQGDARFKALMVANAMAIAGRAAALTIEELPDPVRLCADIRAGQHDGDAALRGRLADYAEARCRISSKASASF